MRTIEADIATVGVIDAVPKLLEVVCRSTQMGFAAVARVTEDRWVACAVRDEIDFGLKPGGELDVVTTICDEIRASCEPVVIDHVAEDPRFRHHPTPAQYGFQSYISVPIVYDGEFFGTLCAIDPAPRRLKDSPALKTFELFAELIGAHLASRRRLETSEQALLTARETEELREQFIAILGHDLRNPLASIDGGLRLLGKAPSEERAQSIRTMLKESVQRMAGLIDNLLDLARGRLGGGFPLERRLEPDLGATLRGVLGEMELAFPGRRVEASIDIGQPVQADGRRLAQLLSNLVSNALTYGAPDAPVRVRAHVVGDELELSVANAGPPISAAARARMFEPYARDPARPRRAGLGLGLWICAEVARAHGGVIGVTSNDAETCFTVRIPVRVTEKAPQLA